MSEACLTIEITVDDRLTPAVRQALRKIHQILYAIAVRIGMAALQEGKL